MPITLAQICRYPVKGLNAERLARVHLTPGEALPQDRRFAIAHGSAVLAGGKPEQMPNSSFFTLLRDERLALLRVSFDEASGDLAISRAGKRVVHAKATEPLGRTLIEQFLAGFLGDAARGAPKLLEAPGHSFADAREKCLSLINLASVHDLERVVRQPIDPLRFRANLYIEGAPAWSEFDWAGTEIEIGGARLRVTRPIDRCAATNVDPETAARDMNIPLALKRGFGHVAMGVYAEVVSGGEIATGDRIAAPA